MSFRGQQPVSTSISWAPWPGATTQGLGIGRPFVIVPPNIASAQLSPPIMQLPLVWRSKDAACFELPLPARQIVQPDVHLRLIQNDGTESNAILTLSGGISRPETLAADDTDEEMEATCDGVQAAAFRSASIMSQHAESVSELTFPRRDARIRPVRAEGLTITSWEEFDQTYWAHDDEDGPLRLIVRIALDCSMFLERICERPRRILRRERQPERLDRVQQMDDACIRWFVRQPGRTILEKAGPRQRVLSVVRLETADTPENRIVRDFLERCLRASHVYVRENTRRQSSYRVQTVRRFRNRLVQWIRRSDIAQVPLPDGVPKPNYVLQFDERYSRIWYWYERLRRQQLYEDEMWRWQHRTWAEHMALAFLRALGELQGTDRGFRQEIYLRSDQSAGRFIDERSSLGVWVIDAAGSLLIESFLRSQIANTDTLSTRLKGIAALGADLVLATSGRVARDGGLRVLAVWSSLGMPDASEDVVFARWLDQLTTFADGTVPWDIVTPALMLPVSSETGGNAVPKRMSKVMRGAYAVGFALPVPINSHLPWLTAQIADWVREGVL